MSAPLVPGPFDVLNGCSAFSLMSESLPFSSVDRYMTRRARPDFVPGFVVPCMTCARKYYSGYGNCMYCVLDW